MKAEWLCDTEPSVISCNDKQCRNDNTLSIWKIGPGVVTVVVVAVGVVTDISLKDLNTVDIIIEVSVKSLNLSDNIGVSLLYSGIVGSRHSLLYLLDPVAYTNSLSVINIEQSGPHSNFFTDICNGNCNNWGIQYDSWQPVPNWPINNY